MCLSTYFIKKKISLQTNLDADKHDLTNTKTQRTKDRETPKKNTINTLPAATTPDEAARREGRTYPTQPNPLNKANQELNLQKGIHHRQRYLERASSKNATRTEG